MLFLGRNDTCCPPGDVPPGDTTPAVGSWATGSEWGSSGGLEPPVSGKGSDSCGFLVSPCVTGSAVCVSLTPADESVRLRESIVCSVPTQDATRKKRCQHQRWDFPTPVASVRITIPETSRLMGNPFRPRRAFTANRTGETQLGFCWGVWHPERRRESVVDVHVTLPRTRRSWPSTARFKCYCVR